MVFEGDLPVVAAVFVVVADVEDDEDEGECGTEVDLLRQVETWK